MPRRFATRQTAGVGAPAGAPAEISESATTEWPFSVHGLSPLSVRVLARAITS